MFFENEKGITVVEMLVAIFIIGILAGFIYTGLTNYRGTIDLNGITRELLTDLRYAQELAVAQQVKHGIQFFRNEKKYQIIKYGETEEVIKEKQLPEGISFKNIEGLSLDRVRFTSFGAVEEAGIITLESNDNLEKKIKIRPSGFIEVEN